MNYKVMETQRSTWKRGQEVDIDDGGVRFLVEF